jgi:hypothetical protein
MKTDRGYIVAMYNKTNKIVTFSLEMWRLIENIDDYKPLYRADDKKDAENYVKEISSNIQKEPTMVNKQEFIEKARKWFEKTLYIHTEMFEDVYYGERKPIDWVTSDHDSVEELVNDFCKAMEE